MEEILQTELLLLFTAIPLLGFLATLPWKNNQERIIAGIVRVTKVVYALVAVGYAIAWWWTGTPDADHTLVTLFEKEGFLFTIIFRYDAVTAAFSITGAMLFLVVATFSKYYMHRDEGYKRYFNTILLFAFGYNLIVLSANFETLFIGWEIIGISSFLLIAFYRKRYLPVKNAFKVLSYYRISDVMLMLAMWMLHHLTHRNILFDELASVSMDTVSTHREGMATFIAASLLIAVMVKSASFPFSHWLPRAMEGPTTSSAIFYGSLSVHTGVFLLLRTYPFWEHLDWVKVFLIIIGLITALTAGLSASVQPTVKTQIAYASATQIGIIFIEIALGFHTLALWHFMGNAFLRTYQLLVSPSVLNYLVHHQYFHRHKRSEKTPGRIRTTLYMLGLKEWMTDDIFHRYGWKTLKRMGAWPFPAYMDIFGWTQVSGGLILFIFSRIPYTFSPVVDQVLTHVVLLLAIFTLINGFAFRGNALRVWNSFPVVHLLILAAMGFNDANIPVIELTYYLSGVIIAWMAGYWSLSQIRSIAPDLNLKGFHGNVFSSKGLTFVFLLSAVGVAGFPLTATFIGVDLLFTYVHEDQFMLAGGLGLCFFVMELSAVRIFLRIFNGPHPRLTHPVALRSS
jgi:NADH-quinone oxidoreductase subunit L